MSDSVWLHRRQPTRLPHPWDSPGKNTGVGCHFLLQCMKVKNESEVAQSCRNLSDPMDCSLPGSSIHEIFHCLNAIGLFTTGSWLWISSLVIMGWQQPLQQVVIKINYITETLSTWHTLDKWLLSLFLFSSFLTFQLADQSLESLKELRANRARIGQYAPGICVQQSNSHIGDAGFIKSFWKE